MDLGNLKAARGAVQNRKRLGRGTGSGLGKTSGKGHKGAGARSGGSVTPGFEGGQMPLQRRLPKRGFHNPSRDRFETVSLAHLDRFPEATVVDAERLRSERLVRRPGPVKILSDGKLTKALTVRVHAVSVKAREKIVAAGGSVEVIPR